MRSIKLAEIVDAPAGDIYSALSNSSQLTRWFPTRAEASPVAGGSYSFEFGEKGDPGYHVVSGNFTEVVPNKKVAFTWNAGTLVEFTIDEGEGGTKVSLDHSGWGDSPDVDTAYEMHMGGWGMFLRNLKSVIETGKDLRPEVFGAKSQSGAGA